MKINKKNKDELNYKQAYYYLFNKITEVVKTLEAIQRKAESGCTNEIMSNNAKVIKELEDIQRMAEDICVDEIPDNAEIDTSEILKKIINKVKEIKKDS